jgi:lysophospholipase L1-like esterase
MGRHHEGLSGQRSLILADHHQWIQTGIPNWPGLLPDGVHPNAALYAYKADNLYTIMNPLIQNMLTHG